MTERNQHLDEGTIHAWLDGALAPGESARVQAHANSCAACAALVAEARGLVAAASRILSSLDAVPAGVIPGSDGDADQLAALRARRNATARRWWRDPRVVAAASLVFMAGTFSVVWRSSANQSDEELTPPVTPGVVDFASPTASAPTERPSPAAAAESPDRETKSATQPSPASPPPRVVVTGVGAAAEPDKKIGAADAALRAPGPVVAANESRRADSGLRTTDSITAAKVVDRGANVDSLVRQRAALSPRLAMEPLRTDTGRAPAPAAEMARRSVLAGQASGAGLRLADAASVAGACYQLRVVPSVGGRPSVVADTVRLLDEAAPERSDPSWRRARAVGASPSSAVLLWREIDSVTVELQARGVSDTSVVRFRTTGTLPDVRSVSGARAAFAVKVACP